MERKPIGHCCAAFLLIEGFAIVVSTCCDTSYLEFEPLVIFLTINWNFWKFIIARIQNELVDAEASRNLASSIMNT